MQRISLILAVSALLLSSAAVRAQNVKQYDVSVSYVAQHSFRANLSQSFTMQGGSAEFGLPLPLFGVRGLGLAASFTGVHTASIGQSNVPLSLTALTAGPRYRLSGRRFSPYGEFLVGYAHGFDSTFLNGTTVTSSANSYALQVNGGLDYALNKKMAVRVLELGWLHTAVPNGANNNQDNFRIGAGIVFRFH